MRIIVAAIIVLGVTTNAHAADLDGSELIINGFRSPSIGLEYRRGHFSVHAGAYTTIISKSSTGESEATWFAKVGSTFYFLPLRLTAERPSMFFVSAAYMRGFNADYDGDNALFTEAGFRWAVWKGLDLRLGAGALMARGHTIKVNPTPGIGWAFTF